MKLKSLIILAVIVIGAIGIGIFNKVNSPTQEETVNLRGESQEVSLTIDGGSDQTSFFQSQFKDKMTAFDLLKEKTEESGLSLETKSYDIGIFIEKIGEKKNGENEKYWMYYVNGELPMVSSDKYELRSGDKVEFKFEKSDF